MKEKCVFCNAELYFKVNRYLKPVSAPLTRKEELEQELEDITGEAYVKLNANYCPMCGRKLNKEE